MYLCLDCGCVFEEPATVTETHGLDSPPYESYLVCPECDGDFVETDECKLCGNWITGAYVELANGDMICDECYRLKHVEDLM